MLNLYRNSFNNPLIFYTNAEINSYFFGSNLRIGFIFPLDNHKIKLCINILKLSATYGIHLDFGEKSFVHQLGFEHTPGVFSSYKNWRANFNFGEHLNATYKGHIDSSLKNDLYNRATLHYGVCPAVKVTAVL